MSKRFTLTILCAVAPHAAFAKLGDTAAESVTAGSVSQMLIGLCIVVAILIGGALLVRRVGQLPSSVDSPLKIVTGMSLGPRDRLVVVQVGAKQILLGLSPGRIQTLHVLDEPLDPNSSGGSAFGNLSQRFGSLLQSHMKK